MKQRLLALDNLRGFLIIIVVIGHCIQFSTVDFDNVIVFRFIYAFHMPLFMWLSGFVNFRDGTTKLNVLKRRAIQLALPFLSWTVLQSIFSLNRSEPFRQAVDAVLAGKHGETILRVGDNYCQVTGNPVFSDGAVTGGVLLLVDITEKIQRENLRREFTANVSHELKTPLTSISGFAEIIQDGFVKPQDVKIFAGKIFDEAQRLITLVGDVIKISQLDEGCLPYQKEDVDVYVLAKNILERFKEPAEKKGISLYLEREHAVLSTVEPILDEVLANLCDNAVKYNRTDGNVTVTVLNGKYAVSISVADTGLGISQGEKTRIFERFYRVEKSHSKEVGGTGLGLSIVKHGAAFLGAKLELESTLKKGSTFRLIWEKDK